MRGGDHDPGIAVQMPDREREQGGRSRLLEKEDLEAGRGEDPGAKPGEFRRMMPRVVGDHARSARAVHLARGHIVGQSAGAFGDRALVEHIGADRVHLAAPAAGAKLEHGVKRVVELTPALVRDLLDQRDAIPGKGGFRQPAAHIRGCRWRDFPRGLGSSSRASTRPV